MSVHYLERLNLVLWLSLTSRQFFLLSLAYRHSEFNPFQCCRTGSYIFLKQFLLSLSVFEIKTEYGTIWNIYRHNNRTDWRNLTWLRHQIFLKVVHFRFDWMFSWFYTCIVGICCEIYRSPELLITDGLRPDTCFTTIPIMFNFGLKHLWDNRGA